MSIYGTVQSFDQGKWIDLFVLDATNLDAGYFYFCSGENELGGNILWQGQEYIALPIEASGFAVDSGAFPRPRIKIANVQGIFSTVINQYKDLIGTKVIRKRTAVRYLDAVNFSGGNPSANPAEHLDDDIFFITQKISENKLYIEFELGSALDLNGVYLPRRCVNANYCTFVYRGEECSYVGTQYWNRLGVPVISITDDRCGKTVSDCKLRFGDNGELPFGAYPGSSTASV